LAPQVVQNAIISPIGLLYDKAPPEAMAAFGNIRASAHFGPAHGGEPLSGYNHD